MRQRSNIRQLLRKTLFLLMQFGGVFIILSCSDNGSSNLEVPDSYVLQFDSCQILEFKAIESGKETNTISNENLGVYFGKRVELNQPYKLEFKTDSLLIYKDGGIVERYKSKWLNNELFLFNALSDSWRYCGEKSVDNSFLLNTGFYSIKHTHPERISFLIGQGYSLKSYTELTSFASKKSNTSFGVWLKVQYTFK